MGLSRDLNLNHATLRSSIFRDPPSSKKTGAWLTRLRFGIVLTELMPKTKCHFFREWIRPWHQPLELQQQPLDQRWRWH